MREFARFLLILIIFGSTFGKVCFSQTMILSEKTQKIVNKIEKVRYILVDGEPTNKNIKLAKQLLICSTTEELYRLLESDKPSVICFASWILAKKGDLIIEKICNELTSKHEKDGMNNINKIKRKSSFLQIETSQSFVCIYLKQDKYLRLLD